MAQLAHERLRCELHVELNAGGAAFGSLFAAPILRGLDSAGTRAVENAGRLRQLTAGERVFTIDDLGDSFYVVERGEI